MAYLSSTSSTRSSYPSPDLPMKALKRQNQLSDGAYNNTSNGAPHLRLFQKNGKRLDPEYHEAHKKKALKTLPLVVICLSAVPNWNA
ncbi:hypothetical protein GALMADRAFT_241609 [Galerina marginata CBS 339.88]|uniref:Uncharacterized protein n=1 Tax=Galerina marginata (strain CBS 339.88) TaxID=685588 RepID=A0A067TPW7_GALM3|nr:hypothetical protein GALMADRAFT_241609 [Galerina marginata CBS 339.88]